MPLCCSVKQFDFPLQITVVSESELLVKKTFDFSRIFSVKLNQLTTKYILINQPCYFKPALINGAKNSGTDCLVNDA